MCESGQDQIAVRLRFPDQNIILIGPSGAGKTATAPILSQMLGLGFCDTDELITTVAGITGGEIISRWGISHFREIEELVVRAALAVNGRVVAIGAGAWTIPSVRTAARHNCISVLLQVPRDELVRRLTGSDRVIVKMHGAAQLVDQQLAARSQHYGMADVVIDCADLSPQQIAERVRTAVKGLARKPANKSPSSGKEKS